VPACLVTDLRMPGMNGLEFQRKLSDAFWRIPMIFVTGHGDVPTSVRAMKAGAVEFLLKPFQDQELFAAIEGALALDVARRGEEAERATIQQRYKSLTRREREVMNHVISGVRNKHIAATLNITEKTVKFHRAHIMNKMLAGSVAALVQTALKLGLHPNS
jgi:FixJ family two-component response regulator